MKELIKQIAIRRFLKLAYDKVGLTDSKNPHDVKVYGMNKQHPETILMAETFNPLIKATSLPDDVQHINYKYECETDGSASKAGYYPEGSFYRLGIIVSGRAISTEEHKEGRWLFANGTLHFDKDMNLIKYQRHTSNGMDELTIADIPEIGYKN